jgi:NAD(P)-dependent dehydrogenase (short-subunit alcohol dehydrogenase family)
MDRLKGKRAVVTGAASGIGRASAILFAAEGAKVVAADVTADGVAATVDAIKTAGGEAVALAADVASEDEVTKTVETCREAFGGIEVYFANAGIVGDFVSLVEQSRETIERVLAINLIAPMLAIKHAAPHMIAAGGGSIVMTASVAGLAANSGPSAYSASKAGVINLAKVAASELMNTNVRVNAICPGLIETGMTRFMFDRAREKGTIGKMGQLCALQRHGLPEEMAQVALFLASDEASYVNGQAIAADGGLSNSVPFVPGNVFRPGVSGR